MTDPLVLTPPDSGVLFVVSGPSGVGKSTLIKRALATVPDLRFSVSATTRGPRPGEVDGQHYIFLDQESFQAKRASGAFLEFATVYGRSYGTLARPTREALERGESLLLDIDVAGSRQVRESFPDAVHLFVLPPDRATVERRLRARATDAEDVIARRMAEMDEQLRAVGEYDYVVVNDHLPSAHHVFEGILLAEVSRRERRGRTIAPWTSGGH